MVLAAEGASVEQASELLHALVAERGVSPAMSLADRALLDYAEKLTRLPAAVSASDIDELRRAGFTDLAIHDACAIVAYYAFVNRIADGLGVELESAAVI